jgi:hypothetical protein
MFKYNRANVLLKVKTMKKQIVKPKYSLSLELDFTGYSGYWHGHGHALDNDILACIVAHVPVSPYYKEKNGEILDRLISEVNSLELDFHGEAENNEAMQAEINIFLTNELIRKEFRGLMRKGERLNMFFFDEATRHVNDGEEIDLENDESPQAIFILHIVKNEE